MTTKSKAEETPKSLDEMFGKFTIRSAAVWIKGATPLIFNSMSSKVKQHLLFPPQKLTANDKAQKLKHDVDAEFRASPYYMPSTGVHPTLLGIPATAFKAAAMNAAIETPGAKKTQIGRLVYVDGETIPVYGIPELRMDVVRSADMARTPDIRTRATLPEWCCRLTVKYATPTLTDTAIVRLLEISGLIIGVGDYRQEKGKGNYGQFTMASEKDVQEIIKNGGRKVQEAAMASPKCYNQETQELYDWYKEERKRRGR